MNRIGKKLIIQLLLIVFSLSVKLFAAAGDTPEDPIFITNLIQLRAMISGLDKHYRLANDIDASATRDVDYYVGDHDSDATTPEVNMGFEPIGNSTDNFTGSLNGAGFVISGLYINRPTRSSVGVIGYASGATVDSLGVENVDITGKDLVGSVVGFNRDTSAISNCYSSGLIYGESRVGGVVGGNGYTSTTSNCYSTGIIKGDEYVGGVVGYNYISTVSNSFFTGLVNGNSTVGGVVGYNNNNSTLSNSYSTGLVYGTSFYIGGVAGRNEQLSAVSNCYSTGGASGDGRTGGAVGGGNSVANVSNTFWYTESSDPIASFGGTAKTIAELKDIATFTSITTEGLTTAWDFIGTVNDDIGVEDIWSIAENGYPFLAFNTELNYTLTYSSSEGGSVDISSQGVAKGTDAGAVTAVANSGYYFYKWSDGRKDNPRRDLNVCGDMTLTALFTNTPGDVPEIPILITNVTELQSMIDGLDKHYKLVNDIDATITSNWNSAMGFESIGTADSPFTGSLDGNGHVIRELYINRPSNDEIGLIGYSKRATIVDLGLINPDITARNRVGSIVGYANSWTKISTCFVEGGSVLGEYNHIGGLVGTSVSSSLISDCYSLATVEGNKYIGGLVGYNGNATIQNSYAASRVFGTDAFALVGSSGNLSVVNNCFWNGDVTTKSSAVGMELTTAEMKNSNNFTAASWDFEGETVNGTKDIWTIFSGSYPRLSWQNITMAGSGTVTDPYLISTLDQLQNMNHNKSAHYQLMNDIDASDTKNWNVGNHDGDDGTTPDSAMGFEPIGNYFSGSLNGRGFTISNIYINRPNASRVGLIGSARKASVDSLYVLNCEITGKNFVGAMIGEMIDSSTLENCSSSGSVSGQMYVGGITGLIANSCGIATSYSSVDVTATTRGAGGITGYLNEYSSIFYSYSTGTVYGSEEAGGIAGKTYESYISNSYSSASITGTDKIGGLAGWISYSSILLNCYSSGLTSGDTRVHGLVGYAVSYNNIVNSTVSNCFWDSDTTVGSSYLGTGLSTVEMKKRTTFIDAGWDFTGETVNGTDDIWIINESIDYPRLAWENNNTNELTVSFTSAFQSGLENIGTMIVTVELSEVSSQDVTVPFILSGSATGGGTDYTITSTPVIITAGATTATITISVIDDAIDEVNETVIITMGTPINATQGATSTHTATIIDNDDAPVMGTVIYTVNNATMGEITGGDTSQTLEVGTSTTEVTASPKTGYHFKKWSDDLMDAARTDIVSTDGATFTAIFAPDTFTLSYSSGSNGSLFGDSAQVVDYNNDGLAIVAVADNGYHFVQWSDGRTDNPRIDTSVTEDITVTALFDAITAIDVIDTDVKATGFMAYPNPVLQSAQEVTIALPSKASGKGICTIYDALGEVIDKQVVTFGNKKALLWDLRNSAGEKVSSGSYIAILQIVDKKGCQLIMKTTIGVQE